MKSYLLEGVASGDSAEEALRRALPGQERPWLLLDAKGDVMAYFNVDTESLEEGLVAPYVSADISGSHEDSDERILGVLRTLQSTLGGVITYSP